MSENQRIPRRYPVNYAEWSGAEYWAIARNLLTCRVSVGPDLERLTRRLSEMYRPDHILVLNFAHHGIGFALSWFQQQRPGRNEVIVPAYVCPSVPQTVRSAGLRVRCVPVGDDLNLTLDGVRNAIGPDTLAVIAPHMYGCPAPIGKLEVLCREAGVYLIDDAAQTVGERLEGRLLGTFGDVGVISFAQSKAIVTGIGGSGGVLLANKPEWTTLSIKVDTNLHPAAGRLSALADFVWNYTLKSYTGMSGYYWQRFCGAIGLSSVDRANVSRISNIEAAVALVQMDRLEQMRSDRLRVLELYSDLLPSICNLNLPQYYPGCYLTRAMVRLPEAVDVAGVRRYLFQAGVGVRDPYPAILEADRDQIPNSNQRRLIGLPISANLEFEDIRAICLALHASILSNVR